MQLLKVALVFLGFLGLGEAYGGTSAHWLQAAFVNTLLFALILIFRKHRIFMPCEKNPLNPQNKNFAAYLYYLPAVFVLFSALALVAMFRFWGGESVEQEPLLFKHLLWVVWIPVVEEVVFRFGLSSLLRSFLGFFLGTYLSILFFVLLHGPVGFYNLLEFRMVFPIGVFFMAIICDAYII